MNKKILDFDKCSEENKAKGGVKGDWKASSDKTVSESIPPESDISKETNMRNKEAIKRFGKGCKTGKSMGKGLKRQPAWWLGLFICFLCLALSFLIYFYCFGSILALPLYYCICFDSVVFDPQNNGKLLIRYQSLFAVL